VRPSKPHSRLRLGGWSPPTADILLRTSRFLEDLKLYGDIDHEALETVYSNMDRVSKL
jgi:hypothetical protein